METVETQITKAEEKKHRYFDLYEIDQIDTELFSSRLTELNQEIDKLHSRKSELEYELKDDYSEPISYDLVRSLIERFEDLLQASTFEERKML